MSDEKTKNKEKQLLEMVETFAEEYIDDEYKELSNKLVKKLGRKHDVPFKRGNLEIWASAVIYALGQINFLFDKSFEPYLTPDDICDYFNTKKSTVSTKAKKIRDTVNLGHYDKEFSTNRMLENNPLRDMVITEDGLIIPKSELMNFEENNVTPANLIAENLEMDEEEYINELKNFIVERNGNEIDNYDLNNFIDILRTPMPKKYAEECLKSIFGNKISLNIDLDEDIDLFDDYVINGNNPLETIDDYEEAIDLFRSTKGKEYFKEHKGDFWSLLETRPFMSHLLKYSMLLWNDGETEKSVDQLKYMLELNPGDNQGIRYILINRLLELNRLNEVIKLLEFYDEEDSATWEFSKLLLSIKTKQEKKLIKTLYHKAVDSNKYVVPYLINKKKIPKQMPEYYGMGDENEAIIYVDLAFKPWNNDKTAIETLKEMY
ncbi:MAG: DUF6398 domain-containing protein [Methanobrevibacter sp.]|jgi:tetratricopeptide (TPR) repeat protein|nr:DUF6398 domain-containing protein [Candidatus Methanovirga australis]